MILKRRSITKNEMAHKWNPFEKLDDANRWRWKILWMLVKILVNVNLYSTRQLCISFAVSQYRLNLMKMNVKQFFLKLTAIFILLWGLSTIYSCVKSTQWCLSRHAHVFRIVIAILSFLTSLFHRLSKHWLF